MRNARRLWLIDNSLLAVQAQDPFPMHQEALLRCGLRPLDPTAQEAQRPRTLLQAETVLGRRDTLPKAQLELSLTSDRVSECPSLVMRRDHMYKYSSCMPCSCGDLFFQGVMWKIPPFQPKYRSR
jgi:hypothetical protein